MTTNYEQVRAALEALDVEIDVTGGGRGWTARTNVYDSDVSAKGTSKVGALEALLALVEAAVEREEGDVLTDEPTRAACLCGCGGQPARPTSRFLPGHDARYHSAQKKAAAETAPVAAPVADRPRRAAQRAPGHGSTSRAAGSKA